MRDYSKENDDFFGFYYVNKEYADYLRDPEIGDKHVPVTDYGDSEKFFVGAVLSVEGMKYFAPVTSNVNVNKGTFSIFDRHGNHISSVRLNFMFPVDDEVLTRLNIDNIQNRGYRDLVSNEILYCTDHKRESCSIAKEMYDLRKGGKYFIRDNNNNKIYINNFAKLEKAAAKYKDYIKTRVVTTEEQTKLMNDYHITLKECDDLAKHAEKLKMSIKQVLFTIASFDRHRFSEETRKIIDAEIASKRKKPGLNQGSKTQEKINVDKPVAAKPKKKNSDYNCR